MPLRVSFSALGKSGLVHSNLDTFEPAFYLFTPIRVGGALTLKTLRSKFELSFLAPIHFLHN